MVGSKLQELQSISNFVPIILFIFFYPDHKPRLEKNCLAISHLEKYAA